MKSTLLGVCLVLIFASCQKNHDTDNPPSSGSGRLTAMWSLVPDINLLQVDSLEFDDKQRLARFKFISYTNAKEMSLPAHFDPTKHDSAGIAVLTFQYQGNDSLPATYTISTIQDGGPAELESHGLAYDNNGRITVDTLVGGANGCKMHSSFQKMYYMYGTNRIIVSTNTCGSTDVLRDTLLLNNGNITLDEMVVYTDPSNISAAWAYENTFSSNENPFFKYKLISAYAIGQYLFSSSNIAGMSRQLEATCHQVSYYPSPGDIKYSFDWTLDDKSRVIGGHITQVYDPNSNDAAFPEQVVFHYAK